MLPIGADPRLPRRADWIRIPLFPKIPSPALDRALRRAAVRRRPRRAFSPGLRGGIDEKRAEIAASGNPEPATFDNTIDALERAGARSTASRACSSIWPAPTSTTTRRRSSARSRRSSRASAARSISTRRCSQRIEAVHASQDARAASTPRRGALLERYHLDFMRAGAGLPPDKKARLAEIAERLATLGARVRPERARRRKGLRADARDRGGPRGPAGFRSSRRAAATAAERGHPGKHAVTLSRSSVEPFLQFSARRDLREKAFARLVGARRERRRARQSRHRRRNGAAARRAGAAARLCELR